MNKEGKIDVGIFSDEIYDFLIKHLYDNDSIDNSDVYISGLISMRYLEVYDVLFFSFKYNYIGLAKLDNDLVRYSDVGRKNPLYKYIMSIIRDKKLEYILNE
jgi:hypothetical protein